MCFCLRIDSYERTGFIMLLFSLISELKSSRKTLHNVTHERIAFYLYIPGVSHFDGKDKITTVRSSEVC